MRVGVNATFVVEQLRIGDPGTMSVSSQEKRPPPS
jgi:hypothetical protein